MKFKTVIKIIIALIVLYVVWVVGFSLTAPGYPREASVEGMLRTSMKVFYRDCGRYPESFTEMASTTSVCPGWKGPILTTDELIDTWGSRYLYVLDNINAPIVISSGPDRAFGTEDDISFGLLIKKEEQLPVTGQ
ncbi:MAG TPA: type II secretion system protein GspG [Cellvibrionaceae bacterium]